LAICSLRSRDRDDSDSTHAHPWAQDIPNRSQRIAAAISGERLPTIRHWTIIVRGCLAPNETADRGRQKPYTLILIHTLLFRCQITDCLRHPAGAHFATARSRTSVAVADGYSEPSSTFRTKFTARTGPFASRYISAEWAPISGRSRGRFIGALPDVSALSHGGPFDLVKRSQHPIALIHIWAARAVQRNHAVAGANNSRPDRQKDVHDESRSCRPCSSIRQEITPSRGKKMPDRRGKVPPC